MRFTKQQMQKERRPPPPPPPPPEGGWGWMIVIGCFLATICIRAVTRCVSMFFVEFQLHFEKDYSTTAWIHSLIDCTTMLCAPLGGFLGNRISCRATVILGGLLSSAGLILSSFASSLEHLYICLGVLTGLGFALSYTTSIAMVGKYFSERKALAYGIAMSGSGIGTFVLAPAVQMLIEHYSWRGALLVLGGFVANLCVCGALMRPLGADQAQGTWQSSVSDLDSDSTVSSDGGLLEQKELELNSLSHTQALLIATGALKDCELERDPALLGGRADPTLGQLRISECILFSNTLMDLKLSSTEALVEANNLNNKRTDVPLKPEGPGPAEDKPKPVCNASACVPTEPAGKRRTFLRSCPGSAEEYGFLLIPEFLFLSVSFLFLAMGCSPPVVYLVPYALSLGMQSKQAALLMSVFGISGIVGNITFGWITDRKCLKRYRLLCYVAAVGLEGLCCMLITVLQSFPLLALFSVLYGYFDGAYVALIPVVTSDVVGPSYLTSALGIVYFLHAIPYLVSPPIGGLLVDRTGNYGATFFLCGVFFVLSSAVLVTAVLARRCRRSRINCLPDMDGAAAMRVGRRIRVIGDELDAAIRRVSLDRSRDFRKHSGTTPERTGATTLLETRAQAHPAVYVPELLRRLDVPPLVAVGCLSFVMGWCLCSVVHRRS
ncbi:monocarboxylate transporter 12-B-like [Neosynchiropus ocellatus]